MQYSLHSLCHLTKASDCFPGCFLASKPQPSSPTEQIRNWYLKSTFTVPSEFQTTNNWVHLISAGWKLTLSPSSSDGMQKSSAYCHVPCGPRRKDALSSWAHLWATLSHGFALELFTSQLETWPYGQLLFLLKGIWFLDLDERLFFLGGGGVGKPHH